mmetsp:Transcript_4148/g.4283  ORF Transcript_4148/g.4283 Transcript_4148/m.4283 type:complete len:514 (+) Transcript_4148:216-1757(+)
MRVLSMRAVICVSVFVFAEFIIESKASFDALIKFDNITAIWRNKNKSHDQLYLVYPLDGAEVRYDLPEQNLRYFCWLLPEEHSPKEINALPLISGEKIDIGISSEINEANRNKNHIDKNLHIFRLAERQHSLIFGVNQIPFAKLNAAMTSWKDMNIIIWRQPDDRFKFTFANKASWGNYTQVTESRHIQVRNAQLHQDAPKRDTPLMGEDMRLLVLTNGSLFATWHNRANGAIGYGEIHIDESTKSLYVLKPTKSLMMRHERSKKREKNWIFFEYGRHSDNLLFIVTIQPLRVVMPTPKHKNEDLITNAGKSKYGHIPDSYKEDLRYKENDVKDHVHSKRYNPHTVSLSGIKNFCWNYGELRGGTEAKLVGGEYLAFFHSQATIHSRSSMTYWMGAYTFSRDPPFRITSMSKYPIVAPSFGEGWTNKKLDFVIFPMSFSFDEDSVFVTYGKNDGAGWVLNLNRTELFQSLRKVESIVLGDSVWDSEGRVDINSFTYLSPPEANSICRGPCEAI